MTPNQPFGRLDTSNGPFHPPCPLPIIKNYSVLLVKQDLKLGLKKALQKQREEKKKNPKRATLPAL
jgi:hypothetical protein